MRKINWSRLLIQRMFTRRPNAIKWRQNEVTGKWKGNSADRPQRRKQRKLLQL